MSKTDVFQSGVFQLASGKSSLFKIECDNLSDDEIGTLSGRLAAVLPPFRFVIGVPTGGYRIAQRMHHYRTVSKSCPILVVDDVWTTGSSWRNIVEVIGVKDVIGGVFFARGPVDQGVTALFQMPEGL